MWSMMRCWQCSSVTAQVTAAMSQVQPSLQMLVLPNKVCGCTTTAVDGLCMAAVMWGDMTPYSFWMTHSSHFWDKWLYTALRWMLLCSECLTFYVTWQTDWLLCYWRVNKARHKLEQGTICGPLVGSRHSHVKGPFLSCSVALVARAGVRCTACVGKHERSFLTTVGSSHR